MLASQIILGLIFNDCNHFEIDGSLEDNIRHNREKDAGYFFDFHFAADEFWHMYDDSNFDGRLRLVWKLRSLQENEKSVLINKLELLRGEMTGTQGIAFLSAIEKKTGKSFGNMFPKAEKRSLPARLISSRNQERKDFRDELLRRIEEVYRIMHLPPLEARG